MYIISCVRIVLSSRKTQIMVLVIHFLEHRHPHACWQVYKDAVAAAVLGAARWATLISCSPERWSPGVSGYCPLSLPDAGLVFQENLFQYSLPLPLDPVLVQKIVSRHLKLPGLESGWETGEMASPLSLSDFDEFRQMRWCPQSIYHSARHIGRVSCTAALPLTQLYRTDHGQLMGEWARKH